ncbi:glycosyltransferase [Lewinella sp. IMCC34183]|uniref:glycosyltransferase n=1 Tax=Lewinella sp. IMCC34183 TaxID=2248762 RepID=UPI000E23E1A3|nr:glycosyltransferase family 2 protein [Lewinella sp. IMCC34183]
MLNDPVVRSPTRRQLAVIRLLILIGLLFVGNFCYHFFSQDEYFGHPLLFGLLCTVLVYGLVRDLSLWYYYADIKVPETPPMRGEFTVDVLTTYFPGEPYDMVVNTLRAIQKITYPHTTYLCDEANDPYLKGLCKEMGIIHVTRTVRVNAKAGNINNALQQATGDICLVLDPDHIPQTDFLDHIVPHFQDPEIGFVQTVQAYYNKFDTLVAKGSAQQTFHFYGPMMMTMNSYGTVNAIGANCTFRRAALDTIGGHAPGLAEDMHTAMRLYSKGWKSVYVPRILAKGLVPASLTAYFKQQIKWSRGVFDLLVKVYPRIFTQLTWRQRLHYALMPIHYLAGLIYLMGFLIPVLSLVMSDVPWTGNFFYFLLLIGPVLFTSFILRFYIQKWLISDDERGFHIVGGILEILTWWIFTLGFVYTLVDKKVPYLPTPKNDDDVTHFSLLLPNLLVGVVSLAAIAYGLPRDFTPFSLAMAAFALLNAAFMFFTIYLGYGSTNHFGVMRRKLPVTARSIGRRAKRQLLWSLDAMTVAVRTVGPLLLLGVLVGSLFLMQRFNRPEFYMRSAPPLSTGVRTAPQLGIFYPSDNGGLSDLEAVRALQQERNVSTDIVSAYIPWSGGADTTATAVYLRAVVNLDATPLITWEPWVSHFPGVDSLPALSREEGALAAIAAGRFDAYVLDFATMLSDLEEPVYLRFAHEFDNPDYPWSPSGNNRPEDFIAAWRHVHRLFQQAGATNVDWVWNPWRPEAMTTYYPGAEFVDYVGLTLLNYGPAERPATSQRFTDLYTPFAKVLDSLPTENVILAEFASLGDPRQKQEWLRAARTEVQTKHPEIAALVAFNSSYDTNLPDNHPAAGQTLDWTLDPAQFFYPGQESRGAGDEVTAPRTRVELPRGIVRAVGYKKAEGWRSHLYIPSRKNLEEDFGRMRKLGINAIRITSPGIYSHNLLTIAPEYDLRVIYNFWVPDTLNFLRDTVALADLRREILESVADHHTTPALLNWDFSNDVLTGLSDYYLQPELHEQRLAYLRWLTELIGDMHDLDPAHAVMTTIAATESADPLIRQYRLLETGGDALGLSVPRGTGPELVARLLARYPDGLALSDIRAGQLARLPADVLPDYQVLTNWQNEWKKESVTFDGLLDFEGRPTVAFTTIAHRWDDTTSIRELPEPGVILPAVLPYVDAWYTYRAAVFLDNDWRMADQAAVANGTYEWRLIRTDGYGNATAMTRVGTGPVLKLQLPPDHLRYELMLTLVQDGYSRSVRTTLLPK